MINAKGASILLKRLLHYKFFLVHILFSLLISFYHKNGYKMDTIYCQLTTSANEGNSGSPVVTKNGELVGIITSTETNAAGVVFAIKASNIFRAVDSVKKMDDYQDIKISSAASLKGMDRVSQIKKMQDYVFMIKGN